jgi:hypothetical protein
VKHRLSFHLFSMAALALIVAAAFPWALQAGQNRSAVPIPGTITIRKQTLPDGDPQGFSFTGQISAVLKDGEAASQEVGPGSYTVQEVVPKHWDLNSISCSDDDSSGNVEQATATFVVDEGESVTCTFTNTKRGMIVVQKQTVPGGDLHAFSFSDQVSGQIKDGEMLTERVPPGIYTVREDVPPGWDLTAITCDDSNSSGDLILAKAIYKIAPGERVQCLFTNTKRGAITIAKDTVPDGNRAFWFNGDLGRFTLIDDGTGQNSITFSNKPPGIYDVTETVPGAWRLTGILCVDPTGGTVVDPGQARASISLAPGDEVTCTFTNTALGSILVRKATVPPGAPQEFKFTGDATGTLSDGQYFVVSGLGPGTYTATEVVPEDWRLAAIDCDDDNSSGDLNTATAIINLEAGELVDCKFTNTRTAFYLYLPRLSR